MSGPKAVDPYRCRLWDCHPRVEGGRIAHLPEADLQHFSEHGQLIAAVGRPVIGDMAFDFEVICGARRLAAAQQLNRPLMLEIRSLSDRDAAVALDIENRQRQDLSPYERARSIARWLRAGVFKSQEEAADALCIGPSQVSRLLKLARLPAVIVAAFPSASSIREAWGLTLVDAMEEPSRKRLLLERAREIAADRVVRPEEAYRRLVAKRSVGAIGGGRRERVVRNAEGSPLFRIKFRPTSIALILPQELLSSETLARVEEVVKARMLTGTLPQFQDEKKTRL